MLQWVVCRDDGLTRNPSKTALRLGMIAIFFLCGWVGGGVQNKIDGIGN